VTHTSAPELLILHGVRILGGPSVPAVAERFSLPAGEVREYLMDAEALGWVTRHEFFGETWSMTSRGRAENERQLAAELDATGARGRVESAHAAFVPLNRRHGQACTNWQLRPMPWDRLAFNDHTDHRWDDRVMVELELVDRDLRAVCDRLTAVLARFDGHAARHTAALERVRQGHHAWLDAPDRASCQLVWMQLHEDLLATLGLPRGSDS
jgi:hypothetical protein